MYPFSDKKSVVLEGGPKIMDTRYGNMIQQQAKSSMRFLRQQ